MVKNEPIVLPSPEMVEEYVNKAVKDARIKELEAIKAEIEDFYRYQNEALKIIDKHISELKGENNDVEN